MIITENNNFQRFAEVDVKRVFLKWDSDVESQIQKIKLNFENSNHPGRLSYFTDSKSGETGQLMVEKYGNEIQVNTNYIVSANKINYKEAISFCYRDDSGTSIAVSSFENLDIPESASDYYVLRIDEGNKIKNLVVGRIG